MLDAIFAILGIILFCSFFSQPTNDHQLSSTWSSVRRRVKSKLDSKLAPFLQRTDNNRIFRPRRLGLKINVNKLAQYHKTKFDLFIYYNKPQCSEHAQKRPCWPSGFLITTGIWKSKPHNILWIIGEICFTIILHAYGFRQSFVNKFIGFAFDYKESLILLLTNRKIHLVKFLQLIDCQTFINLDGIFGTINSCNGFNWGGKGEPVVELMFFKVLYLNKLFKITYLIDCNENIVGLTANDNTINCESIEGFWRHSPDRITSQKRSPSLFNNSILSTARKSSIVFLLCKTPWAVNEQPIVLSGTLYREMYIYNKVLCWYKYIVVYLLKEVQSTSATHWTEFVFE